MRIKISFITLILITSSTFAQTSYEWFPDNLNIHPFTANFLEPKTGFSFMLGKSAIRLDIGTSSDFISYYKDNSVFSFGADLFTYTRLRGEKEFHFPVETIDYLFGVNAGYKVINKDDEYGARFRLSHISAHFVDGHFDYAIYDWRNGRIPRVYSREFIELFPYYKYRGVRVYAGLTYLLHTSPKVFGKGIYQFGFDYYAHDLIACNVSPFAAFDFKLSKIKSFTGSNILSAGIKFGKPFSKGFTIFASYFSGSSIHGEYFDYKENYGTIGFNIDI